MDSLCKDQLPFDIGHLGSLYDTNRRILGKVYRFLYWIVLYSDTIHRSGKDLEDSCYFFLFHNVYHLAKTGINIGSLMIHHLDYHSENSIVQSTSIGHFPDMG